MNDIESMTEPSLLSLPHPKRLSVGYAESDYESLFRHFGMWDDLVEVMKDQALTLENIYNNFTGHPGFRSFLSINNITPGSSNLGVTDTFFFPIRYQAFGSRFFQVEDTLNHLLCETDIGAKTPVRFFTTPYPSIFIEFGKTRDLPYTIHNIESGDHILEGCYVNQVNIEQGRRALKEHKLNIDISKPYRVIELMFIGSPVNKANILDDATLSFLLIIQDEDESLEVLLEKHIDYYRFDPPVNQTAITDQQVADIRPAIFHLAKALLYINSEQSVTRSVNEYSDMKERIARTGTKKQGKLTRKLDKLYDKVVISHKRSARNQSSSSQHSSFKSHWRRGHFRNQRYGEQNSKQKLIWIEPVLVGLSDSQTKSKEYVVR